MAATINLRAFPYSEQINCSHCHKPVTLYDPDGSEFFVCPECQWYNKRLATNTWQTLEQIKSIHDAPNISIGATGTLRGTPYKVIGYMEKKESGTDYDWREYMLYNYTKGYAFLSEYDGHWNYIAGTQHFAHLADVVERRYDNVAELDGADYTLFNNYAPIITGFTGEYDWDVYNERIRASEYIHPPYMLVREKNKKNELIVDWYFGEYMLPQEVADAFNISVDTFPETIDIGANEPNPHKARWLYAIWISIVAAVALIAIQICIATLRPDNIIMDKQVDLALPPPPVDTVKRDTTGLDSAAKANLLPTPYVPANGTYEFKSLRTSSFTINGPAPVEITLSAPVDNNWFECTVELVNEKDNQTWDVSRSVEYYHGYEDGESWSEGSNNESTLLNDIPPGNYHLNIYPYAGTGDINHMNIKVEANVTLWQNIFITLVLLCIYPLICWYLKRRFEINRWMNSDYSPYQKEATDD